MTNTIQRLFTASVIALALAAGSSAFADTPQGNLDAAIADAQQTLGQISFEGAKDPDALRKKLAGMLARIAQCEVQLLRDIKNALVGFLNSSAFDPLHDLINKTGALAPEEDFFREIAKRLFGPDGAIAKDMKNPDSLGLFSSLERAIAQDWYPPRDSSDVMKKMFDPLWEKALAGGVGEGALGAAIRQLALVRKLLAQLAHIRVLHAKAYPPKSVPTIPGGGGAITPPKAPSETPVVTVGVVEAKKLVTLVVSKRKATKTIRIPNSKQTLVLTFSPHPKNKKLICPTVKWQFGVRSRKVPAKFRLPNGRELQCIAPKGKLPTGAAWDIGLGWTLKATGIDAKIPPRQAVLDLLGLAPGGGLAPAADQSQPAPPRILQLPPKISF